MERFVFFNAMIWHLPIAQLDQSSLLLILNMGDDRRRVTHFKTKAAWFMHEGFKPFVEASWGRTVPWMIMLRS